MRDIKFRAWDSENKWMDNHFWVHSCGSIYDIPDKTYDTPHTEIEQKNSLIIMQYTGLKDCNGVGIYEGDIFYSDSYPFTSDDMVNYRGVVVFEEGTYYYDMYAVSNRVRGAACGGILAERASELTVVGNIYENPELLVGEQ